MQLFESRLVKRAILLITLPVLLAGCQTRPLLVKNDPAVVATGAIAKIHDIYVISNREYTDEEGLGLSHLRSATPKFSRYSMSVPARHKYGYTEWSSIRRSRADKHFEVSGFEKYAGAPALVARINASLTAETDGYKSILLFVHGFNYSYPETIIQAAQLAHDTNSKQVQVAFAWPSRAALAGYGYDRESVTFSRDDLTGTLKILAATNADSLMILSHSMGSMLTMEAMRQLTQTGDRATLSKIRHVTLASPDIDPSVFFKQFASIDPRPEQFVVMTSQDDRALTLSQSLLRSETRIGKSSDVAALTRSGVDVVDITGVAQRGPINHTKFATRPAALGFLGLMSALQHPAYKKLDYKRAMQDLAIKGRNYGLKVFPAR